MQYTTEAMRECRKQRLEESVASYRFMSVERFMDDVISTELWIADPGKFNDPFDLAIAVDNLTDRSPFEDEKTLRTAFGHLFLGNVDVKNFWYYDDDLIETLTRWIDGRADHLSVIAQFKRRAKCFGVTCFAPDWDVPLMWAHYGHSHAGVCVEWAIKPIPFAAAQKNLHLARYPVRYMTKLPTICLSELLFAPHQVLPSFVASKHADWAYEKEWRLVNFQAKGLSIPMPEHMEMSAIIVGLNFDKSQMDALIAKAASMNLPVYRVIRPLQHDYDLMLDAL